MRIPGALQRAGIGFERVVDILSKRRSGAASGANRIAELYPFTGLSTALSITLSSTVAPAVASAWFAKSY